MANNVILPQNLLDELDSYGIEGISVWDTNVTNIGHLTHLENHGVDVPQAVIDFVQNAVDNNTSDVTGTEASGSKVYYVESNNEERITSSAFRNSLVTTFPVDAGKEYIVHWTYETCCYKNRQIRIRVYIDGNIEQDLNFRSNFRQNYAYFESNSSFTKFTATENKDVNFTIQVAAERGGYEVRLRNLKLLVEQKEFI